MKKVFFYALAACILCCNYACNEEDTQAEETPSIIEELPPIIEEVPPPVDPIVFATRQEEKASADNYFAFNIFKEVSKESGANTFFSPLSLNMALGMLFNGASGDTRTEMAEVLGMAGFTETEINEYYQNLSQTILTVDPLTDISIANSIWYRDVFPVKKPFIDVNQTYFDALVQPLDFRSPDAADIINKWCADKTKDRIKDIIAPPIPKDVVMYLINALYFKSKWQFEFDKANTKQEDFTKAGNQKKKVNMMEQAAFLPYYADEKLQCVEMPYGNQSFSMVAILPAEDWSIEQLIDYLNNDTWKGIVGKTYMQQVWIKLPRFKIECDIPLNVPVENMGMKLIFDEFRADFENMYDKSILSENLYVSEIKQKTFVEVNEEGTEAAAVTVIIGVTGEGNGGSLVPVPFFANRPFLYLIKEKSTGTILFIGRMDEPEE